MCSNYGDACYDSYSMAFPMVQPVVFSLVDVVVVGLELVVVVVVLELLLLVVLVLGYLV